jgi:ubiquinone/menaquinone biosynthesis C-methylase UbiE
LRRKEKYNIVDYQNRYRYYCQNILENCKGHGNCLLDRCICDPGWIGEKCEVPSPDPVEPCNNLACSNDATVCDEKKCYLTMECMESPNDFCHFHPDYGVIFVPFNRWSTARLAEMNLWMTLDIDQDRNEEHQGHFDHYRSLLSLFNSSTPSSNDLNLGHVLEIASGPYTQVKTILESIPDATLKSLTLLEPNLMEYRQNSSGCSYKDGYLKGHRVNFLVGRAEDFLLPEAYDLVIMINGMEHCQDGVKVLNNLYHSIKPGGILIWHERTFDDYTGMPFEMQDGLLDFVFHPLRLKTKFWEWFIFSHFETLYFKQTTYRLSDNQQLPYFIGRKPEYDVGWEYMQQDN